MRALLALWLLSVSPAARAIAPQETEYAWLHGFDAHGREVTLGSLRGQVVVLTFVSRDTREEGTDINDELAKLARAGQMTVLSIVDLEDVPGFAHGLARSKIAEADRAGLVHLVDDKGTLREAFHVDPTHAVTILVIDRTGAVRGRFMGEAGLEAATRLVEQLK